MRVVVASYKCIASGTCALTCPEVFDQRNEDGVVRIVNEHPPLALLERVRRAVDLCPSLVFRIEDEEQTDSLTLVEEPEEV
jgi:ferredoxin